MLADCKIDTKPDEQNIISNKFFKGSGPAQPYLNYALYLLIYYCPDEAEVDYSLRKKNINKLNTNMFFPNYWSSRRSQFFPPIENFTSLYELEINLRAFDLKNIKLKDVLKNSSVEKIRINNYEKSLMWLKNFPQLNNLYLGIGYYGELIKDLHAFEYVTNLEELEMSCTSENIDFLKKCVKIKKLTINLTSAQNIDALKYLTKLEELDISGIPDGNYAGLSYCKKLKNLIISSGAATNVLANLKSCSALEKLDLKSNSEFNIKLDTRSFYGINKFNKLKKISLDGTTLKF